MIEIVLHCLFTFSVPAERWDFLDSLQLELSQSELTSDDVELYDLNVLDEEGPVAKYFGNKIWSNKFLNVIGTTPAVDLNFRSAIPAFLPDSPHPSTYRGGAESGTARLKFRWGKWTVGSVFDKDAYEPRWDDLFRFYLVHENNRMKLVAGDFNVVSGLGLTFWNRPFFASTSNFMSFAGQDGIRLTPASNTSVNRALRGIATYWAGSTWQLLCMISNTRYDAVKGSDDSVLRLSDGGYHRSDGEEIKRETLGEQLAGFGAQTNHSLGTLKLQAGVTLWEARLSPGLQPVSSATDPYPLSGRRIGATGFNLVVERGRIKLRYEIARDRQDHYASAFQTVISDLPWKTRVKTSGFYYPSQYSNPHAAEIAGRQPKGKSAVGISLVKSLSIKYFNSFTTSIVRLQDKFPSAGDSLAKTRTELSVGARGTIIKHRWEAKIFNRNVSAGHANLSPERSIRIRCHLSRLVSDRVKLIGWIERAEGNSELNHRIHGWAAGSSFRARIGKAVSPVTDATTAINVEDDGGLPDKFSAEFRTTCTWFKTSGLPVYEGDISYPDRIRAVRMNGWGLRLGVETVIFPAVGCAFSLKAARTYPLNSSTSGDGELYLAFTLKT